jgi:hypothetical protein
MKHVPPVDPEELRELARRLKRLKHGPDIEFLRDIPADVYTRYVEFNYRHRLRYAFLLPRFMQDSIFKAAATAPLESALLEPIEEAKSYHSARLQFLTKPTGPVIL